MYATTQTRVFYETAKIEAQTSVVPVSRVNGRGVKVGLHGVWGIITCMHVLQITPSCILMYTDG